MTKRKMMQCEKPVTVNMVEGQRRGTSQEEYTRRIGIGVPAEGEIEGKIKDFVTLFCLVFIAARNHCFELRWAI
jgi:hypothetical protein